MIFKFNLISKYREELMGYAIFGVLVSHLLMWLDIKIPGVNMVLRLIYTQGFLFLSGFGLYYSLSKSSEILPFYKRRVKRLYIPFVLSCGHKLGNCFVTDGHIVEVKAKLCTHF